MKKGGDEIKKEKVEKRGEEIKKRKKVEKRGGRKLEKVEKRRK